jgi:hypothetical protein
VSRPLPQAADRLVGGWLLERWEIAYGDGRAPTLPFGERPTGLISYTPDGWMSATISAPDRPTLSQPSPRSTPAEELAKAFTSYFAYAGRWRVEGEEVVHEVRWALNSAMVGTEQRRQMTFGEGAALTLSAEDRDPKGVVRMHRIFWRRAANDAKV